MSDKKQRKGQPSLATIVTTFWAGVEERCLIDGVPISEHEYYGIRPEDRIQLKVTKDGKDALKTCTVSDLWRTFCAVKGINHDLFLASSEAVTAGMLRSSTRRGKDTKDPSKTRSYGVQFWTPSNPVYLAKKTATPADVATPQAVIDALLGVE